MRRLSLALVLFSLLLAGCAKPAAEVQPSSSAPPDAGVEVVARGPAAATNASQLTTGAAGPTTPSNGAPLARLAFAPPVALPIVGRIGGGEPNIAALPDGTLFVTSPAGSQASPNAAQGAAYLWRSTDDGATWETLREPAETPALRFGPFCSCDADVTTSVDGWVYYTDWWLAGITGNYLVEASADGGNTWTQTPVTTREALGNVDRQWLVAGADGFVALFYAYFVPVSGLPALLPDLQGGIHVVTSHDHGASWSDPVAVVPQVSGHGLQIAHARIMPDGTLIMPYGDVANSQDFWRDPSRVMLAVSTDQGATWEHSLVADAPQGFDNLWAVQGDVDATGAIHVGWAARIDDDIIATYIATSRDAGKTWTTPLALRATGLNFLPWVTTMGNDTVAMGWYGGDATGDPTKAEGAWFAYVAESRDGGNTFAMRKVDETPVKEGKVCPKGAACPGDRELLDYVSLVFDAKGALHYAFARSEDGIAMTRVASAAPELLS